jgi:hypothetical protein
MTGFQSKRAMSMLAAALVPEQPKIRVLNKSIVDGGQWYTVSCAREASIWLRDTYGDQEGKMWFQNIDELWHISYNIFDINEDIYTLLTLKWA